MQEGEDLKFRIIVYKNKMNIRELNLRWDWEVNRK